MLSLKVSADLIREVPLFLRAHRQALSWRQVDLAKRSRVPVATLRRFERTGRIGFPSLAKLIAALGLVDRFLDALEPKPPQTVPDIATFLRPVRHRKRVRLPKRK